MFVQSLHVRCSSHENQTESGGEGTGCAAMLQVVDVLAHSTPDSRLHKLKEYVFHPIRKAAGIALHHIMKSSSPCSVTGCKEKALSPCSCMSMGDQFTGNSLS